MKAKEAFHKCGQKNKNVDKLHLESPFVREQKPFPAMSRRLMLSVSGITFVNVWEGSLSSVEVILTEATNFEEWDQMSAILKHSYLAGHSSHNLRSLSNVYNWYLALTLSYFKFILSLCILHSYFSVWTFKLCCCCMNFSQDYSLVWTEVSLCFIFFRMVLLTGSFLMVRNDTLMVCICTNWLSQLNFKWLP
jgi:hypothetical protein